MLPSCPKCHTQVRPTDYFCFNCGENLKPKPPSTDTMQIISLFLVTILLPPMGIFRGIKYLGYDDQKLKLIGIAAIVITILELVLVTVWTVGFINTLNQQVSSQMNNLIGF